MQTSAAPFYFEQHNGAWDGGLGANNPSEYAYDYARALFTHQK